MAKILSLVEIIIEMFHLTLKKEQHMKEYKVIVPKIGFRNRVQNFEDILNQYAREGWTVNFIGQGWASVVLERDKNR